MESKLQVSIEFDELNQAKFDNLDSFAEDEYTPSAVVMDLHFSKIVG